MFTFFLNPKYIFLGNFGQKDLSVSAEIRYLD